MPYETPTSADVAALIRTRAKTTAGQYEDDFTTTTRPTKAQVESMIGTAEALILPGLGDLSDATLDDACQASITGGAKALVTVGAAMLVEASHWPEQQGQGDQSSTGLLRDVLEGDLYDRIARAAAKCRGESGGGDEDAGGAEGPPTAGAWGYPEDRGGMIGHGTRW